MPEEEEFALTDLSERLRSAGGEKIAEQVVQRLTDLGSVVDKRLTAGVSPDEYQRLRRQSGALAAAQRIMIKLIERSQALEQGSASKSREERRG
jgi:hypothetical protein